MKKLAAIFLCIAALTFSFSCGQKNSGVVQDGKTVNVMMVSSGWGRDWIDDIAAAFNELYEEDGYRINILEPRANFMGTAALSEMRLGNSTGYDLVITDGVTVQAATNEEFGICVESLSDIYELGAINFDGTEDTVPLKEKYKQSQDWYLKKGDEYYGFPYSNSIRGLVINTTVLDKYGITTLPVTTDELFEMYDIIYNGANGVSGMAPAVWAGANAYGYANPVLYVGLAQLMGIEEYDRYMKMDYLLNEDGKIAADGYTMAENPAIKEVLESLIHQFDPVYSVRGSTTQRHDQAHAQILTGKAAFMHDGNYFFNEASVNFSAYLDDMTIVPIPVVSYLGVQLKLDGTGNDRAKCDEILSYMCSLVDEGSTAQEIKTAAEEKFTGITITDEQAQRIFEARTIGYDNYTPGFIIKDSPVKDIAKLFLRMMASKDAAEVYAKYGMMHVFETSEYVSEYEFINNAMRINSQINYYANFTMFTDSVRAKTNLNVIAPYNALLPVTLAEEIGIASPEQRNYALLATNSHNKIIEYFSTNWEDLMRQGGYSLAE